MREDTLSDLLGFPLGPVAYGFKRRTGGSARLKLNHGVVADLLGCSATALCEKTGFLKTLAVVSWFNCNRFRTAPNHCRGRFGTSLNLTVYAASNLRSFNDFQLRRNHFHFIKIVRLEVFKGLDQLGSLFRQIKAFRWVVQ